MLTGSRTTQRSIARRCFENFVQKFNSFFQVAMLAISYYNMGIEEDHCGNHENAKSAFAKAYELIEKTYGADDPFAKRFFAAYNEVRSVANLCVCYQCNNFLHRNLKCKVSALNRRRSYARIAIT